jgi:hypothetical protein
VSGQLHAPAALPPGQTPRYPLYRRFGGSQSRPGRHGEVKILDPPGTRTPKSQLSSCILLFLSTLRIKISHHNKIKQDRQYCIYIRFIISYSEILGSRTLSIVLVLKKKLRKNTTFRKLDLFPSSGEGKTYSFALLLV